VHRAPPPERQRTTYSRLSGWLRPDGVIIIMAGKAAGNTDNRSLV
jgi:hypothetical protein